jgi:hypothetical protein
LKLKRRGVIAESAQEGGDLVHAVTAGGQRHLRMR